ncbi:Golgi apyrase [Geranomyces variabilis]|uniref:Golgi apyrase n=1 Tax=Geranomyces variabilis TaxID=109894 RepID=A0AAD5XPI6_9FUNG|nr:Golgi apyrase [Geranomyces variabilis]
MTAKLASAQYPPPPVPSQSTGSSSPAWGRPGASPSGRAAGFAGRPLNTGINVAAAGTLPMFADVGRRRGGGTVGRYWVAAKRLLLGYVLLASPRHSAPDLHPASEFPTGDPDSAVLNLESGFPPLDPSASRSNTPATAGWTANRQYGIVIDAGSSGSRIQVYSWIDPLQTRAEAEQRSLPIIDKADEEGARWQMKQEPGISSFAGRPETVAGHLQPLLDFAELVVPKNLHASTPIYLLATAGMRLVSDADRDAIMAETCNFVRTRYAFATLGGCARHFRVISGELEGIYGWITVNYLKGGFDAAVSVNGTARHTYGFLDMGGASTQIAFEPTPDMAIAHNEDLTGLKLRFLGGEEVSYRVFVSTFLGFGVNEARRRYLEGLVAAASSSSEAAGKAFPRAPLPPPPPALAPADSTPSPPDARLPMTNTTITPAPPASAALTIPEPCLPRGLVVTLPPSSTAAGPAVQYNGTGVFRTCLASLLPLLNKSLPCPELPCLFNGVHAPISDALSFLGVSEYWYTSSDVYGLGGAYDHAVFLRSTEKFCAQSWEEIQALHAKGAWPAVGSMLDRLHLQCFKSAWILTVLHDGLGVPREKVRVPGDDDEAGGGVGVVGQGASGAAFESVNEIGRFGVSWTLGAMLMHVAAIIPTRPNDAEDSRIMSVPTARVVLIGLLLGVVAAAGLAWWWRREPEVRKYVAVRRDIVGLLDIAVDTPR